MPKIERVCQFCGKDFMVYPSDIIRQGAKFCSHAYYAKAETPPMIDRFWANVDKSAGPDGCWLWTGNTMRNSAGMKYGKFWASSERPHCRVHRFSYELVHGPIPDSLECLHKCDVPLCVNPTHLFLGTQADNVHDAISKGRFTTGERNGFRIHPESHPRGEQCGNAKLTAEQVLQIRALYGVNGENTMTLARRFGVGHFTIGDVVFRRTWKHI